MLAALAIVRISLFHVRNRFGLEGFPSFDQRSLLQSSVHFIFELVDIS